MIKEEETMTIEKKELVNQNKEILKKISEWENKKNKKGILEYNKLLYYTSIKIIFRVLDGCIDEEIKEYCQETNPNIYTISDIKYSIMIHVIRNDSRLFSTKYINNMTKLIDYKDSHFSYAMNTILLHNFKEITADTLSNQLVSNRVQKLFSIELNDKNQCKKENMILKAIYLFNNNQDLYESVYFRFKYVNILNNEHKELSNGYDDSRIPNDNFSIEFKQNIYDNIEHDMGLEPFDRPAKYINPHKNKIRCIISLDKKSDWREYNKIFNKAQWDFQLSKNDNNDGLYTLILNKCRESKQYKEVFNDKMKSILEFDQYIYLSKSNTILSTIFNDFSEKMALIQIQDANLPSKKIFLNLDF